MPTVPTFLALTTARAGLATKAMGAFVKVKIWEPVDNNDLNQVVASSGLSGNKDLGAGGVLSLAGSYNLVLVILISRFSKIFRLIFMTLLHRVGAYSSL